MKFRGNKDNNDMHVSDGLHFACRVEQLEESIKPSMDELDRADHDRS